MKKKVFVSLLSVLMIFMLALTGCSSNSSQSSGDALANYPNKNLDFIVAYSAGGGSDVGARILGQYAEKLVGKPITIVNKPGAGGAIGFADLKNAKPDGYTMGLINIPSIILLPLQNDVAYRIDEFEPVIQLVEDPGLLIVKKDGKFKSWEEFAKYAEENPGKLTVGNCGHGTDIHIAFEAISQTSGLDLVQIPYAGTNEAVTAVLGDHVDATIAKVSEAIGPLKNDQVMALAAVTNERLADYPDVPTLIELGIDIGAEVSSSRGVAVPKNTPQEIIDYLHDQLKKATEEPEYIEKMNQSGLTIRYRSAEEFKEFIEEQNNFYESMVNNLRLGK